MSSYLPIKSSSRAGRFKKKLVNEEVLLGEAPEIEATMAPIVDMYHQKKISSAEFAAIYILAVLARRSPGTWLGAKREAPLSSHNLRFCLSDLTSILKLEPN